MGANRHAFHPDSQKRYVQVGKTQLTVKPPLYYFSVENDPDSGEMIFHRYASWKQSNEVDSRFIYHTKSKIAHGAHGDVYAARDRDGNACAIKIVQETTEEAISHGDVEKGTISLRQIRNAISEANTLHTMQGNDNVIGFWCVGYSIDEQSDGEKIAATIRVILILDLGTHMTLREYVPLHGLHKGVMEASEHDFEQKYGLSIDSVTCLAQRSHPVSKISAGGPGGCCYLPLLEISLCVLDAAIDLHRNSIVHRDFKPENFLFGQADEDRPKSSQRHHALYNIFYERQDIVRSLLALPNDEMIETTTSPQRFHSLKLIDFGSALKCSNATRETSITGTPQYASPELAKLLVGNSSRSGKFFTKRDLILNDVWSIGVLLLEMLLGRCHTGLIEGFMRDPDRPNPSYMQNREADRAMLKTVTSLTESKIEAFTFRALADSRKALQSTIEGITANEIVPEKWVRAVLSLVHPIPARRGTLRSVHVVCRRLIQEARENTLRNEISRPLSRRTPSDKPQTKRFEELPPKSELQSGEGTTESVAIPWEEESLKLHSTISQLENSANDSASSVSDVQLNTEKELEATASALHRFQLTTESETDEPECLDIVHQSAGNVESTKFSLTQGETPEELSIEPLSAIFRVANQQAAVTSSVARRKEHVKHFQGEFDRDYPIDDISQAMEAQETSQAEASSVVSMHLEDDDDGKNGRVDGKRPDTITVRSIELKPSSREGSEVKRESGHDFVEQAILSRGSPSSIRRPVSPSHVALAKFARSPDEAQLLTFRTYDIFSQSATRLPLSAPQSNVTNQSPVHKKVPKLTGEIYECFSRFPVIKRFYSAERPDSESPENSELVLRRKHAHSEPVSYTSARRRRVRSEEPSIVHSFLHDSSDSHIASPGEIQSEKNQGRYDTRNTALRDGSSCENDQKYVYTKDDPIPGRTSFDDHRARINLITDQSPWVYLPYRPSDSHQSSATKRSFGGVPSRTGDDKSHSHPIETHRSAVDVSPMTESSKFGRTSPSDTESTKPHEREIQGIPGEDSWVVNIFALP